MHAAKLPKEGKVQHRFEDNYALKHAGRSRQTYSLFFRSACLSLSATTFWQALFCAPELRHARIESEGRRLACYSCGRTQAAVFDPTFVWENVKDVLYIFFHKY
jgi:hypothetical protein